MHITVAQASEDALMNCLGFQQQKLIWRSYSGNLDECCHLVGGWCNRRKQGMACPALRSPLGVIAGQTSASTLVKSEGLHGSVFLPDFKKVCFAEEELGEVGGNILRDEAIPTAYGGARE